jgi:tetratricopeptide (TPR) repeat protein
MKRFSVLFLLMLLIATSFAESNDELAIKARKAYESGQFGVAISLYEKILGNGYESAILYYNLGNAFFRTNDIPSSILNYEKALKLDPTHSDIRYNLTIANSKITDKVEPIPDLFYKRWWKSFLNLFSLDQFAGIVIVLFALTLIVVAVYLTSKRLVIRKFAFWAGLGLFLLTAILFYSSRKKEQMLRIHYEAIVFSPTVTVKSSPDNASKDLFVIHEGLKVELLDRIGEWQEIRIANGSIGWLKSSDLKLI